MPKIIKNISDLNKAFEPYLEKAMLLTRDEIFKVVSQKVMDYYNEPVFDNEDSSEPKYYKRTYTLMENLTASHVNKSGNTLSFSVGWDDDYLQMRYENQFHPQQLGATGLSILKSFNYSKHGWTVDGEHDYWDEALEELGGETGIVKLFMTNCKKVGLPIK